MWRSTVSTAVALAFGLALAGCSVNAGPGTSPSVPATSPAASATAASTQKTYELGQTFTTTVHGAELTVEIPSDGPAEVEHLRKDLGIGPISYAKVGIDNREGTEVVSVYMVTIYDESGAAYEFNDLSVNQIADWGPIYTDALGGVEGEYGYTLLNGTILDEQVGDSLNRRSVTLHNRYLHGTNASKLEVSTGWLASTKTKLPEQITGITIQPNGAGEEISMTPGGTMPSTKPERSQAPATVRPSAPVDSSTGGSGRADESAPEGTSDQKFTYKQALAAFENGMPYYEAFCIRYDPVTDGGRSQCVGIEAGTVDPVTGEYVGD